MAKFKNDKGLTLIELLITIAVLAVVSAIALPVVNNVVSASNSNALNQTIKDANDFINKYSKSGVVAYDGLTKTFQGYVDTDGDNVIDSNELIDTLTLDANKFAASTSGTSATVGGSYSNGGVTSATITAAGTGAPTNGGGSAYPGTEFLPGDFDSTSIVYGYGGGSAVAYHSFSGSNSQAFVDAIQSGSSQWTATVVNGTQSITYSLNRQASGNYFGPDWSNYPNFSEVQTVIPNFSYTIAKIYVDAATQKLTFILN